MWQYNHTSELYHYGVLGMKWGVRRAQYKQAVNKYHGAKADYMDSRSDKFSKKATATHVKADLKGAGKKAIKSDNYKAKASDLKNRAKNADSEHEALRLNKKAAKATYKSASLKLKSDKVTRTTGYGKRSMRYLNKSNRAAKSAERARYKMAKNKHYIAAVKRKASSIPREEMENGYGFVKDFLDN